MSVFIIIVGVIVFVIGFLGCCGAIKENYCMVTTFAILLGIIFILEIVAGALGFAYRKKVIVLHQAQYLAMFFNMLRVFSVAPLNN